MEVEVDFSVLASPPPRISKDSHNHHHHGSKETFHSSRSSVSKDANPGHTSRTNVSKESNAGHTSRTSATSAASACSSLVASSSGCSSLPASPLQVNICFSLYKNLLAAEMMMIVPPGFQVTRRSSRCPLFSSRPRTGEISISIIFSIIIFRPLASIGDLWRWVFDLDDILTSIVTGQVQQIVCSGESLGIRCEKKTYFHFDSFVMLLWNEDRQKEWMYKSFFFSLWFSF